MLPGINEPSGKPHKCTMWSSSNVYAKWWNSRICDNFGVDFPENDFEQRLEYH